MQLSRRLQVLFALVLIITAGILPCAAQMENATISGRITDQSGAIITGVTVQLQSADRGTTQEATTNNDGIYVFASVKPGVYNIMVRKQGFRQAAYPNLTANVQSHIEQNFTLEVGATSESVTVSATAVRLNTENASVGQLVDQKFVDSMPMNGRSFQSLIYTVPGITMTAADQQSPGQFSTNGQRNNANYFTVDGVSANVGSTGSVGLGQTYAGASPALTSGGGTNGLISIDAMQEFRIQTSSYAPEFGRMPGAQISILTKSGTNQWHGSVYDYLRNDVFDARNYFNVAPQKKPALRQNDFGGTIGGPIWKDRTFFFFSYEGLRSSQPNNQVGWFLMPSERTRLTTPHTLSNGVVAASPWAAYINSMPIPDANAELQDPACGAAGPDPDPYSPGYVPCAGAINGAFSDPNNFDSYSLRIDQNIGKKVTLFGRYSHTPSNQGVTWMNQFSKTVSNVDSITLGFTWTISPTLVNDFRGNWSKSTGGTNILNTKYHGATVLSDPVLFAPGTGMNSSNAQAYFATAWGDVRKGVRTNNPIQQWNFVDTVSKSVGRHQLKFGLDWRRMNPRTQGMAGNSVWADPLWSDTGFPEMYGGEVSATISDLGIPISAHMDQWGFFGQDSWRVTEKLTLTYGLRWDINTPPTSDTGGKPLYYTTGIFEPGPVTLTADRPLWKTQYNAIAPRVAAAYSLNSKSVVRGGFGMFYDMGYGGAVAGTMGGQFPYQTTAYRDPYTLGVDYMMLDLSNAQYFGPPTFTTVPNKETSSLAATDPNLRLPISYQWNAAFERELGANQTITATYVGANTQKLLTQARITPPGSVFASSKGKVLATMNQGYSHYNALQLQFQRRMSKGLQAIVNYTYAHANDTGSSDTYGWFAQSINALPTMPLTRSNFDIRNSFSALASYEIPSPQWGGKAAKAVLGGWSLDGIYRWQSAPPLNVQMSVRSSDGYIFSVQPDLVPGKPIWLSDPTQPSGEKLNPTAFTAPSTWNGQSVSAIGTSTRNGIESSYGVNQLDFGIRRDFNITERVKLDFKLEYFNLFNHPMFGGPYAPYTNWGYCYNSTCSSKYVSPQFGKVWPQVGATLNKGLGGGGLQQGQNQLFAPGGPRSGQISLKISF